VANNASSSQLVDAAQQGRVKEVRALIESGVDINQFEGERTALMAAAGSDSHNAQKIVEILLEKGADPFMAPHRTLLPLLMAARSSNPKALEIVKTLLDKYKKADEIYLKELFQMKLPQLLGIALRAAAGSKGSQAFEIVNYLLENGADPNLQNSETGQTVLMLAAVSDSPRAPEIVDILLKKGANPNLKNRAGQTALMLAEPKKNFKMNHLLETGQTKWDP
jgi:ankyrin repeat protein